MVYLIKATKHERALIARLLKNYDKLRPVEYDDDTHNLTIGVDIKHLLEVVCIIFQIVLKYYLINSKYLLMQKGRTQKYCRIYGIFRYGNINVNGFFNSYLIKYLIRAGMILIWDGYHRKMETWL